MPSSHNSKSLVIVADLELNDVGGGSGILSGIGDWLIEKIIDKSLETAAMLAKAAIDNPHGIPQAYRR